MATMPITITIQPRGAIIYFLTITAANIDKSELILLFLSALDRKSIKIIVMKKLRDSFSRNFWTVVSMEFVERGAYYGVMSILSVYLTMTVADGGLGFSKESVGVILSTFQPLVYFIPILAGALADRYGYRRTFFMAFTLMMAGYALTSFASAYWQVFAALIVLAVGAGLFKPVVTGTIARETNESNSSVGFGIFYWSINLGAFIVPLLIVPYLKAMSWSYIFLMAAAGAAILLLINIFLYKEPKREKSNKSIGQVFGDMLNVFKDYKFMALIVIYSGFWVLYFQMFGTVLWYLQEHVDVTPVNVAVNNVLSIFMENPSWKFDVEHVTVINALTIILLQLIISNIVKKMNAINTMIGGILIGTVGMAILAFSSDIWVFLAGMIIFSVGEMTAHPKYTSYIGLVAPSDKKALYLGYSFLTSVIGSAIAGVLGSAVYVKYASADGNPAMMWIIFASIGLVTAIGLFTYNRVVTKK